MPVYTEKRLAYSASVWRINGLRIKRLRWRALGLRVSDSPWLTWSYGSQNCATGEQSRQYVAPTLP